MKYTFSLLFFLIASLAQAQLYRISGTVKLADAPSEGATVILNPQNLMVSTKANGTFQFKAVKPGAYELIVISIGAKEFRKPITVVSEEISLDISLESNDGAYLHEVTVTTATEQAAGNLRQVEGTAIYAGKKTEVINLENINVNLATNNARQVYSRIAGLNIFENDGGGIQLGIGGRGLNPSRVSNFNTRQNGYDISADALGYPESYYTPPTEAIDKIEIVRGAASLQYGTQFGGMVNFRLKTAPPEKPFELVSRQTGGSFGFFNSFNSIGGNTKKVNYYSYYQYKRGDGWRPNSHFDQHGAYAHVNYAVTNKLKITGEYTFMHYLAQQPGGLTDADFEKDHTISVRDRNWFKVNWNLISLTLDYRFTDRTRLNWRNYTLNAGRDALGILKNINRSDLGGPRDLMSDKYRNYASEIRLLHQYDLVENLRSSLLIGARLYKGLTIQKQGTANFGFGPDFEFIPQEPNKTNYTFPGTNVAVFSENIFQLTDKWNITPGARFEYISTKADGYYYQTMRFVPDVKVLENKQNNRSFVLFGLGSSYALRKGIEVYANISQNYRSINFNDMRVVNENAKVDPLLKDETGYSADAGIRGNYNDWLYYDLSIFYLRYNNRIGSVFTKNEDNMVYRLRTNVADSQNEGIESLIEADILAAIKKEKSRYKLSVYTNFAVIDARYINSQETAINNKLVEFVPPVLFRTGISFGNKRFNVTCQYSYVGQQYSDATNAEYTPTAVDGVVPAHQVMDLSASYHWKWLSVFGSINNLTDSKYFTRRADGYPGPGILPSDPIGYYITLQGKF